MVAPAAADTLRVATLNADLERDGPGLLLRDILRGDDPQVTALADVVAHVAPDILVLQGVDYDLELWALTALRDRFAQNGPVYPHLFALRPNTGLATGHDMDGDGRLGEPEDSQGYGEFSGQAGMAILSRQPLDVAGVRDFSALLWRDMPGALLPQRQDGAPFPSAEAQAALRLASVSHWMVPVAHPSGPLHLLTFHASPPVFDGPEDRNGRRNHDQILFWRHLLDGRFGPPPTARFVLIGNANQDPADGDARREAIGALLDDPRLKDPRPARDGDAPQTPGQSGDPRLDTVDWPDPGPGPLRVSYILPSRDWQVAASGVYWPDPDTPEGQTAAAASRHRMVWVDLRTGN